MGRRVAHQEGCVAEHLIISLSHSHRRSDQVASGVALHLRVHVPLDSPPLALGVTPNCMHTPLNE